MCFSASVSLSAAAILAAIGCISLASVPSKRWIPLALIPLLFSLQQWCEGIIWLTSGSESSSSWAWAYGYQIFAFMVWPAWIPWSLVLLEKNVARERVLRAFLVVGLVISSMFAYALIVYRPAALVQGCHVYYDMRYLDTAVRGPALAAYLLSTIAPFLVSSCAYCWVLGSMIFISCLIALYFYTIYFTSVWCFFAALISAGLVIIIKKHRKDDYEEQ